jgi:hypothetical protein
MSSAHKILFARSEAVPIIYSIGRTQAGTINRELKQTPWLPKRGKRCQEDINNYWMGHKPKTMSELYSHLHEDVDMRLAEAELVGFGFALPVENPEVEPMKPKIENEVFEEMAVST